MKTSRFSSLAAAAALALATTAQARDLTVVSWGGAYQDAQKKVYFEPFKKATSVPMNDESWDGGIGVLRAKVQGGAATWDVVQVESDELAVGCEEGLFEKIEYSKIGGEAAYLPPTVNPCGVGAIVYDFVLGYDKDKLKDAPKGWADFFDTKKYPGKRAPASGSEDHAGDCPHRRRRRAEGRLQGAGHRRGHRARVQEARHHQERHRLVEGRRPAAAAARVRRSGDDLGLQRPHRHRQQEREEELRMVWDGALFTLDSWVILKGSPNKDATPRSS